MVSFSYIQRLPPTRRCAICRRLEIPEAGSFISVMWLCPDCMLLIKKQNVEEVEIREKHPAAEDP